ncbi:MAG: hypothetical protein DME09_07190 [Candidatus Rokuibacteriota bacterium]|nr:MAG: hypothetical protein DME09_07190 [Candidatus Rokubacteria bacterium]
MKSLRLLVGTVATVGLALISGTGWAWGGVPPHVRGPAAVPAPVSGSPGPRAIPSSRESPESRVRHHAFGRHRFVPVLPTIVIVTAPPVAYLTRPTYGPAAYYDAPGIDASGSEAYAPPLPVAPAPPPPMPSVVEYPTGRYELRGDGEVSPYTWVWVPKPPPPPAAPPDMPPPAPPEVRADPPARPIERQTPGSGSDGNDLYRWTDDTGVTHWTNMPNAIPEPYRSQVRRPIVPGGDRV